MGGPGRLQGRSDVPITPIPATAVADRLEVVVRAAGQARGNPGTAGYGAIVFHPFGQILEFGAGRLGYSTEHVAAFAALGIGLKLAAKAGATDVAVEMDSRLVINQASQLWQVRGTDVAALSDEATKLASRFDSVSYRRILPERNDLALSLADDAIDGLPIRRPENYEQPVSTSVVTPRRRITRKSRPKGKRTKKDVHARVRESGEIAGRLGLVGSPGEIASALLDQAPADLEEAWDTLPGHHYLSTQITNAPLSFRDGYDRQERAA